MAAKDDPTARDDGTMAAALVMLSGVALAVAISGGPGDDTIRGTNGTDALEGHGGDDDLLGLRGADFQSPRRYGPQSLDDCLRNWRDASDLAHTLIKEIRLV